MFNTFCGIDFGTTNSAVSITKKAESPILIKFNHNKETIPTAVFFPEENTYAPFYGTPAIERYINGYPGRFMRSLKRILGTDLMNLKTAVNEISLSYEDILLCFIKHLKVTAESEIQTSLQSVVLGRPVHFQDFAPEADAKAENMLRHIAINAGFKHVGFQYEPLAAAYAHESRLEKEMLACVVDVGGGTSDFSLIRLGPANRRKVDRQSDILANTGIRIGGNDFDRDLSIKCFMPEFGYGSMLKPDVYTGRVLPVPSSPYIMLSEWSSVNNLYIYKEQNNIRKIYEQAAEPQKVRNLYEVVHKELGHTLLNKIEERKIALTSHTNVKASLPFLNSNPEIEIRTADFEEAISKDTDKVIDSLLECLRQAGVSRTEIQLIILTGGSTEIPYIKRAITSMFPSAVISESQKFSSVAIGLSYEAMRIYN